MYRLLVQMSIMHVCTSVVVRMSSYGKNGSEKTNPIRFSPLDTRSLASTRARFVLGNGQKEMPQRETPSGTSCDHVFVLATSSRMHRDAPLRGVGLPLWPSRRRHALRSCTGCTRGTAFGWVTRPNSKKRHPYTATAAAAPPAMAPPVRRVRMR